jgi:Asp-tRNA(Asn)/Glu-tRNA(Gln) amidotransferase A subunit family amidase
MTILLAARFANKDQIDEPRRMTNDKFIMQTIHEAAAAIRQRQATPVDLVEICLKNIDRWEPRVHAWVFVDADGARAEAKRLTDELHRGHYRGALHGIPIAIKDIFDVFDWPTAAGSKLWAQSIAREDAEVVKRLRQAGAIFLGKTVTTQYASFDPPVTRNPWNGERTPGGSSSGSAAAVSTLMCLGAMGSQTGGSITRPASYCGVAGCKPTYGLVPLTGILPLAPSMDHPGPIGRCVRDLALLLEVIADSFGWTMPWSIDGLLLGRVRGLFEDMAEPSVRAAMEEVQATLAQAGAAICETALPARFREVIPRHRTIMAVEAAAFHQARLAKHPNDYLPKIRGLLEEGLVCSAPEYQRCQEHQRQLTADMAACFAEVDVLLTPATTGPAPDASSTGNPAFNSPWSYTGLPTVSLPTGQFVEGLPLAIQLVGARGSEAELFAAAAWCEQALGVGPLTPTFRPGS